MRKIEKMYDMRQVLVDLHDVIEWATSNNMSLNDLNLYLRYKFNTTMDFFIK